MANGTGNPLQPEPGPSGTIRETHMADRTRNQMADGMGIKQATGQEPDSQRDRERVWEPDRQQGRGRDRKVLAVVAGTAWEPAKTQMANGTGNQTADETVTRRPTGPDGQRDQTAIGTRNGSGNPTGDRTGNHRDRDRTGTG